MTRCSVWDKLNLRQDKRSAGYDGVCQYYWYDIADHTGDEDPLSFDELTFEEQERVEYMYMDFKREWRENEESKTNPYSFFGISR